ncbi:hypothetical protein P7C73_g1643, partial [Tremellales sp. Uapishka_1]
MTITRTLMFLLKTPLVPPPAGPSVVELTTFTRPRALSRLCTKGYSGIRGYASDHGKKELYSDEAGSTGAGTDDVAHTDAAFDGSTASPEKGAQGVEAEVSFECRHDVLEWVVDMVGPSQTGKDFTKRSPANASNSLGPGHAGEEGSETPLRTGNSKKNDYAKRDGTQK